MGPYEVVISGIGGHFPECDNLMTFQKRLHSGDNLITLNDSRWVPGTLGVDAHTGKTSGINHFDFPFFGMHRSVTNSSDPSARKIMERTFEAIVDAGLNPRELYNSNTSVFVCAMNPEHESVFLDATHTKNPLGIVGASRSMLANRVSFFFNLKGHSCAYGASWFWGGCGLERAYTSISNGECDAALVGGCSLVMHAEMSRMLEQMGCLSPQGVCRPFDAHSDGFVRSEAQVVFLLQRADLAKRAYATVLGATSGSIGPRSENILTPSAKALSGMVRELYEKSGVDPRQVQYIECHGSGHQPSDVAELVGLGDVFCHDRQSPLLVGSVQGNVGHTEAACGLVSASKVITIFETGVVPATLNHQTPHPEIDALCNGNVKVVTEKSNIEVNNNSVFAISDVSFGGEVSHVILKAGSKEKKRNAQDDLPRLVALSGRTSEDLERILEEIQSSPFDPEYYALIHNVFRQQIKNHIYRGYTICPPVENFRPKVSKGAEVKRPLWFVFSGMGSQWPGMGRDLLRFPDFKETIIRCQRALDHTGVDLFKILTCTDSSFFNDILNCFLGISAIQIGLINLLRRLGIKPDGYVGHSLGEQSCAYIDECLNEEQTILAAHARGMASKNTQLIDGMMAAIGKGNTDIQKILPPTIDVACHNSLESSTISGPKADVEKFVEELASKKIFARLVNVANIAYHSRYIKAAGPNLKKRLEEIIPEPKERSARWISSSVPEDRWDTPAAQFCSAEYMTNNLTNSVLFEEAFTAVPENAIILEIAPHGLLQAILRRSSPNGSINASLTQRGTSDGVQFFLKAVGDLYAEGVEMDLAGLYPLVEFPVSRGTPSLAPLISWVHDEDLFTIVDSLVTRTVETTAMINSDTPYEIVQGVRLCSPSHLLMLVWKAIASSNRLDQNKVRIIFKNVEFHEPIQIPTEGVLCVDLGVQVETKGFQVTLDKSVILSGKAIIDPFDDIYDEVFKDTHRGENERKQTEPVRLQGPDIYSDLGARGQEYMPGMKKISQIDIIEKDWIVHLKEDCAWETLFASIIQAAQLSSGEADQQCLYPKSIRRLSIDPVKYLASYPQGVQIKMRTETNVMITEGFYVEGLYMAPIEPKTRYPQIGASAPMFVPLGKKIELTAENMWSTAVHLIKEEQPWLKTISLLELKSTSGTNGHIDFDSATFKNCASNLGFKTRHLTFQVNGMPPPAALSEVSIGSLVVCGSDSAKAATKFLDAAAGAMVLMKLTGNCSLPDELHHMSILCRSGDWVLLRRRSGLSDPKVIHVSGVDVPDVRLSEKGTVLVWQSNLNKEAVKHIVDRMSKTLDGVLFRLFFILDPKAPKFTLNLPLYRDQFDLGLRVNLYLAGSWGTVTEKTVPESVGLPLTFESQLLSVTSTKRTGCTDVHYWGMHEINLKQKKRTEVVLDYAGENLSGKVMGIAVSRNGNPIDDPVLQWPLPDGWSLEDGATVPIAYCQGFLALNVLCNVRPDDNVIVLNASGPEEQAFIRIALQNKCRVFAVVGNDKQETSLKKDLSELVSPDLKIIQTTHKDFYIGLRFLSNINKLDVLVTRNASDLSFGVLSMIAYNGRIVYLGSPSQNTREIIGTNHFLRSTTIYGVSAGSVLSMNDNCKKSLAALMRENLNSGAVKPLERVVVPASPDISWLEGSTAPRKLVRQVKQSTTHFSCDPEKTHLIAGGSLIQNLTLITWLVRRGASHIVVAQKKVSKPLQRRAKFFQDTNIYFEPDVTSALKKATSQGKLDLALIVVQGFGAEEAARNIHEFRNEYGSTLVVVNDSEQIPDCVVQACEHVYGMGVRTLVSAGAANKAMSSRLLDWMLRTGSAQQVTVRNVHEKRISANSAIRLLNVLPESIHSLAALGRSLSTSPWLKELRSIGPICRDAKEVFPLYAIAGFGGRTSDVLKPLASHLLVPVISVQLPRVITSVQQIAQEIANAIRCHQPDGPYSVFGSDWSTVLAEQVSVELRKGGEVVKLFLLDAEPETLVKDAKELQTRSDADLLLIESTVGMNPYSKIHRRLASAMSWEERLDIVLPLDDLSTEIQEAAADSLCFIRDWISAIAEHRVEECDMEKHLIQSDSPISLQYQKNSTVNICQITEPCSEVMTSPELHSYINANMGWPLLRKMEARLAAVKM